MVKDGLGVGGLLLLKCMRGSSIQRRIYERDDHIVIPLVFIRRIMIVYSGYLSKSSKQRYHPAHAVYFMNSCRD